MFSLLRLPCEPAPARPTVGKSDVLGLGIGAMLSKVRIINPP